MRSRYGTNVAFLDAILNSLMGISALFIISFLLIREDAKKKTDVPEPPVQMIVTMTWPTEGKAKDADMDLWAAWGTGANEAVGFRSPVREGIALERDDLGARSDKYVVQGTSRMETIPINQEVISFRRIPTAEITINAMYYYNKDNHIPVPCTVQVVKLNPYLVVYEGVHTLTHRGDEYTFVRFTMNESGELLNKHSRQRSIVYSKPASGDYNYNDWPTSSGSHTTEPYGI